MQFPIIPVSMKKTTFIRSLSALILMIVCCTSLTSCVADDDFWPFSPPPGWGSNYFYDSRLNGTWVLTQANSTPVSANEVNYMEFYGNGHGRYYYYSYGQPESERMGYFCQESNSNTTNYQINVQYEDGSASTMAYWFTDGNRSLWLQWKDDRTGQIVTYIYTRTSNVP